MESNQFPHNPGPYNKLDPATEQIDIDIPIQNTVIWQRALSKFFARKVFVAGPKFTGAYEFSYSSEPEFEHVEKFYNFDKKSPFVDLRKGYGISGIVDSNANMSGYYSHTFKNNWRAKVFASFSNSAPATNQLQSIIQYDNEKTCGCLKTEVLSTGKTIGVSILRNFGKKHVWAFGGELYKSMGQQSGFGLSVGGRYKGKDDSNASVVFSALGHIITSYYRNLDVFEKGSARKLSFATRYEFNVYSHESDIGVGIEYRDQFDLRKIVKHKKLENTELINYRLRSKLNTTVEGLGVTLLLDAFSGPLNAQIGASFQPAKISETVQFGINLTITT